MKNTCNLKAIYTDIYILYYYLARKFVLTYIGIDREHKKEERKGYCKINLIFSG